MAVHFLEKLFVFLLVISNVSCEPIRNKIVENPNLHIHGKNMYEEHNVVKKLWGLLSLYLQQMNKTASSEDVPVSYMPNSKSEETTTVVNATAERLRNALDLTSKSTSAYRLSVGGDPCDEYDTVTNTCSYTRQVGTALELKLNVNSFSRYHIRWFRNFKQKNQNKEIVEEIMKDNVPWNINIGGGNTEIRISPITFTDFSRNSFVAKLECNDSEVVNNESQTPVFQLRFQIEPVPTDIGYVYAGEEIVLNVRNQIELPLTSISYGWELKEKAFEPVSELPSTMKIIGDGSAVVIKELQAERSRVIVCYIYSNKGLLLAVKSFKISQTETSYRTMGSIISQKPRRKHKKRNKRSADLASVRQDDFYGGSYSNPESGSYSNPEPGSNSNPEPGSNSNPEPGSNSNPESGSNSNPGSGSYSNPGSGSYSNSGSGSYSNPESGPYSNPGKIMQQGSITENTEDSKFLVMNPELTPQMSEIIESPFFAPENPKSEWFVKQNDDSSSIASPPRSYQESRLNSGLGSYPREYPVQPHANNQYQTQLFNSQSYSSYRKVPLNPPKTSQVDYNAHSSHHGSDLSSGNYARIPNAKLTFDDLESIILGNCSKDSECSPQGECINSSENTFCRCRHPLKGNGFLCYYN